MFARSESPTIELITNITDAPQGGRTLFAAVGENAEALAAAQRAGKNVFRGNVPVDLVQKLQDIGLIEPGLVNQGGIQGTQLHIYPAGSEFIVPFLRGE